MAPKPAAAKRARGGAAGGGGNAKKAKARCVDATVPPVEVDEDEVPPRCRFPSTILFDDAFLDGRGTLVATPSDWHTDASANRAAERTSHECRLLGTVRLTISLPRSAGARGGGGGAAAGGGGGAGAGAMGVL